MDWKILVAATLGLMVVAAIISRLVVYFLVKSYDDVRKSIDAVATALDKLAEQIRQQNGRVRELEEWRRNHDKWADDIRAGLQKQITGIEQELAILRRYAYGTDPGINGGLL